MSVGVLNQFPLVWSPSLLGFPSTSESTPQPVILLFQSFFFFLSQLSIITAVVVGTANKMDMEVSLLQIDEFGWGRGLRAWFIAIEEMGLGVCCWKLRKLCWVFCRSTYFP